MCLRKFLIKFQKLLRKFQEHLINCIKVRENFEQFKYTILLIRLKTVFWEKICKFKTIVIKENFNKNLEKFNENLNFLLLSILIAG